MHINSIQNEIARHANDLRDTLNFIEGQTLNDEELQEFYLTYLIMAIKDELEIDPVDYAKDLEIDTAILEQLDQLLERNSQAIFELADQFAREDENFISGTSPLSTFGPINSATRVLH